MAAKTQYEALVEKAVEAAEKHPNSYVVLDAMSNKLLGVGTDPKALFAKVRKKLKPNEVPLIYKKGNKDEILIFQEGQ